MPAALPCSQCGIGAPHICPMEKYIKTSSTATEAISRFLSFGVSWSASSSAAAEEEAPFAPFMLAP